MHRTEIYYGGGDHAQGGNLLSLEDWGACTSKKKNMKCLRKVVYCFLILYNYIVVIKVFGVVDDDSSD